MAIVGGSFNLAVTLIDNGANTSTLQYELTSADFTEALVDAAAVVAALSAVTDAEVKSYNVGQKYTEDALSLPAGGVQVENTANIVAKLTTGVDKYATLRIPAPVAGVFVGSSGKSANIVDPNDADLIAYLTCFTAGQEATVSDGEVLDTISAANVSGKRVHRASRKG